MSIVPKANNVGHITTLKKCITCEQLKPITDFKPRGRMQHSRRCIDCEANYLEMLRWAKINAEEETARHDQR